MSSLIRERIRWGSAMVLWMGTSLMERSPAAVTWVIVSGVILCAIKTDIFLSYSALFCSMLLEVQPVYRVYTPSSSFGPRTAGAGRGVCAIPAISTAYERCSETVRAS